jgi:pantothenate synthetase
VRFMADSFERHFLRLLDLEEQDGYMLAQCDQESPLSSRVTALREEHVEFRRRLAETLQALRSLADDEEERFEGLCRALQNLLDEIDTHDAKEVELLEQLLLAKPEGN